MKKLISFVICSLFFVLAKIREMIKAAPCFLLLARTKFLALFSKNIISHLKLYFKVILSRQNKYLIHLGLILVALAFAGFNFTERQKETVSAKENSLLADLLFLSKENKIVKSKAADSEIVLQNQYLSFISVASAAPTAGSLLNSQKKLSSLPKAENSLDNTVLAKRNAASSSRGSLRPDIKKHIVSEGETISYIAQLYGVDAATILTENNLYADDIIKPGMKLTILPVSGASERIDEGETLAGVAQKHQVSEKEILKFNNLLVASDIEVGQVLIVPDGNREIKARPRPELEPVVLAAANNETNETSEFSETTNYSDNNYQESQNVTSTSATPKYDLRPTSGAFSWGWCTWYAAARRPDVTWMGNAGEWLYNAQAQGRATGRIPAVGAIIVTNESWWGHVGIVDAVNGDQITISEMNYQGFGVISSRTISNSNPVIKGYI
ncbi:MAG: LysM peptidoglycan-binding domain-containing protein, partial [Patescibacteria group bacterium]